MDKQFEDNLEEQAETIIGPSAIIQGELISDESITIQGQLIGAITTSQTIRVEPGAKVEAEITAKDAVIGGDAQGHLKISGRLVLLATAKVAADVTCPTLKVEEGALFTGKCHMAGNIPTVHAKKIS
jgi:cytoskeletal protein CcmA (bactofilin family)